jgi:glycosyltransferase involved in cell wall biosynthesis
VKENADKVTVIIPVYNGERYIREALRSILEQNYSPLEIIVVDDGSTDDVAAVLAEEFPGVRYLFQEHAGLSATRNAGLAEVSAGWIGFLDCDDLWAPDKLRMQLKALESRPELEAVFGHIRQFFSPEDADLLSRTYRIAQEIQPGIHPDTMLISAAAVRRIGLFNPAVAMGEFLDWFARAQEAGLAYAVLPEVLAFRRIHASNMSTTNKPNAAPEYAKLLKAALDRRRNKPS